jgi:hypothetical protein
MYEKDLVKYQYTHIHLLKYQSWEFTNKMRRKYNLMWFLLHDFFQQNGLWSGTNVFNLGLSIDIGSLPSLVLQWMI